jgi:hypothetical protein
MAACGVRPRGQGHLEGAPLRRELFAGPADGEVQLLLLLLPTGVLSLRALFQCGPVGLDGGCDAVMLPFGLFECGLRLGGRRIATLPLLRPRDFFRRSLSRSLSALSYSKAALRAALSSVFGGGRSFGLGRLSCGLRPASSSGRSVRQGCIFGMRAIRPDRRRRMTPGFAMVAATSSGSSDSLAAPWWKRLLSAPTRPKQPSSMAPRWPDRRSPARFARSSAFSP